MNIVVTYTETLPIQQYLGDSKIKGFPLLRAG